MRVTVVHTTASAADIAGYEACEARQSVGVVPVTRGGRSVARSRRPRRRPAPRSAVAVGDTSTVLVVRPTRHSVGGGPRARPATIAG
jgi:hypothetical protein